MVSPEFFEKNAIHWFWEGFGHLDKFWAPTHKKNSDPNRKNMLKVLFFVAASKNMFSSKQSDFFPYSALGAPYRGRAHRKDLAVFRPKKKSDPKKNENMLKFLFVVAVSKMCFRPKRSVEFFFSLLPPSRGAH